MSLCMSFPLAPCEASLLSGLVGNLSERRIADKPQ